LHEGSHGLAALLTGGQILAISIHLDGSGMATSLGGWPLFVAFSGYAGASLWAYTLARIQLGSLAKGWSELLYFAIVGLFVLGSLLHTSDLITLLILIFVAAVYFALFRWRRLPWVSFLNQVLVLFILLKSAISPSYLLYIGDRGDHLALRNYTGVPGVVWVLLWSLLAGLLIVDLCRRSWRRG
jgi:hypothetical protein